MGKRKWRRAAVAVGAGLGWRDAPKGPSPATVLGWPALGTLSLGHVTFPIPELLCSVLTATLGTRYPPSGERERPLLVARVRRRGEERGACCGSLRRTGAVDGVQTRPSLSH